MTRTRSGKTLTELLVIAAVLAGLAWMLTQALQRVYAASQGRPRAEVSVSLKGPHRGLVP
jgi:Tfp pilus assembly protein FimT